MISLTPALPVRLTERRGASVPDAGNALADFDEGGFGGGDGRGVGYRVAVVVVDDVA